MNLFATVLTYCQPTANYRGESEMNRSVIQKVTDGRFDYPIISPEAMRNALREILASKYHLPCNRRRLHDEDQLAVEFQDYPDPEAYADDFFFGYLVAATGKQRKDIRDSIEKSRGKKAASAFTFKRDSILRMNLAKALEPYRQNAVFTQSPLAAGKSKYQNATSSALLHRETAVTAFQFPFTINLNDCQQQPDWTRMLLRAIGELNDVAGNHARSYYEMAPASMVGRLTESLAAGFQTYCFKAKGNQQKEDLPDILLDILNGDYDADVDAENNGKNKAPAAEFFVGGEIVKRGLSEEQIDVLEAKGVTVSRDPRALLDTIADRAFGKE